MNKELIITVLIIAVIYFAYQQQENNQSANIIESPNTQQLRSELNHYQKLYQQRVEKDVGDEEKISELEEQITLLEEIINKPTSEMGTQTELSKEDIINLNKTVEYYQRIAEQKAKRLEITEKDLKIAEVYAKELETFRENDEKETQEQLRKINLLFDEKAKDYKTIDFNGLYALLQQIAEREREREPKVINKDLKITTLSHKDKRKLKKNK